MMGRYERDAKPLVMVYPTAFIPFICNCSRQMVQHCDYNIFTLIMGDALFISACLCWRSTIEGLSQYKTHKLIRWDSSTADHHVKIQWNLSGTTTLGLMSRKSGGMRQGSIQKGSLCMDSSEGKKFSPMGKWCLQIWWFFHRFPCSIVTGYSWLHTYQIQFFWHLNSVQL